MMHTIQLILSPFYENKQLKNFSKGQILYIIQIHYFYYFHNFGVGLKCYRNSTMLFYGIALLSILNKFSELNQECNAIPYQ